MDGIQLGKKLKEARLAKKMTQSDVVGDFITRNMLSQIESGAAFPSLRTLEYLANTLEIPIHFLLPADGMKMPENDSEIKPGEVNILSHEGNIVSHGGIPSENIYSDLFIKCKNAYIRGDYIYVIENAGFLKDEASFYYDEITALLARSYLKTAKINIDSNKPKSAIKNAKSAAEYGSRGIYASREVRTEALLLLDELSEKI